MQVLIHNQRVYHGHDHGHTGPSISLREYYQGKNPPPPDTLGEAVKWRQAHLFQG